MKPRNYNVTQDSIRPAGKQDECFYCHNKLETPHRPDCVSFRRTVVMKVEAEVVMRVPSSWDKEQINFTWDGSSLCNDAIVNKLVDLMNRMEAKGECMCPIITATYLREATEEDEEEQAIRSD